MNYGLIESIPGPTDLLFGEQSFEVLSSTRDFSQYLPVVEYQKRNFESSACVSFSGLNCVETLMKFKYKLEFNFSDRFTAKASKTIPGWGNTFVRVANSIRHDGMVEEDYLPWMGSTVEEYYAELSLAVIEKGLLTIKNLDIAYYWVGWGGVTNEQLWEALQYGPVQISAKAWDSPNEAGIYDYTDKRTNHAVMLFKMSDDGYKWIYDHYDKAVKVLSPKFFIGSAMQYSVKFSEKLRPYFFAQLYKMKHGKLPRGGEWLKYLQTRKLPV